jgi:hypothetical protein
MVLFSTWLERSAKKPEFLEEDAETFRRGKAAHGDAKTGVKVA